MVGRFDQTHPSPPEQDDSDTSPENSADSPVSGTDHDTKITKVSFPKRRKSAQKRVTSVTINDGEISIPPADSWAWRKYGQKPIKGSPHPRGYYRCSSSKGCPARKQVEKSRADPNVLLVTYFCEHTHSRPAARNAAVTAPDAAVSDESKRRRATSDHSSQSEGDSEEMVAAKCHESPLAAGYDADWLLNFEPATSFAILDESPGMTQTKVTDADDAPPEVFPDRVEDESLFADLGELPEFSRGFRRGWGER
ncbi:probable WRKY transcription factor 65 [Ipomoea triloba]|uniref:probable WRKY transcription factor 65 n=1 Tax=Ipomoea triloba TaxID=35885 RepID=UPI00125E76E9|nr:probable WRKY transcription factor 65 [Ipomoea triloba]